ncbi:MAG: ASCH domain-containing protein [Candidatus Omnitrophota bacterium]
MNVILSIKPEFADAILSGIKTVEFRKALFKKKVDKVFIYCSSPVKKIIGYFTFNEIVRDTPQNLWQRFSQHGFIDEISFFKYFENKDIGFSICIKSVNQFSTSIDPYEVIDKFTPPQSFIYYKGIIGE